MRKEPLSNGCYYHIISRSIAKFEIFKYHVDSLRFLQILDLYHYSDFDYKFSNFIALSEANRQEYIDSLKTGSTKVVDLLAYCIMPTHFHLIVRQNCDDGIMKYIAKALNSYTRYFNLRYHRKGPLWEGHFRSIPVKTDEQLLHLTRYIHLNPVSAGLIDKPEEWEFSSYGEYIGQIFERVCDWNDVIDINVTQYKQFVCDRIDYQRELSKIKHLLNEDYAG